MGGRLGILNAAARRLISVMEGRPGQMRSTSSFRFVFYDLWSIHYIQERFFMSYRPVSSFRGFHFLGLNAEGCGDQIQSP